MNSVDVFNTNGEKVSTIELNPQIFDVTVKPSVMHEVVKMQLACRRAGTASVKRRSDIKGSTRKLFRQKGTGRARRGNIKSPLLKGGGVVFGPSPKSYAYKVPKKVKKLALKMALTGKHKENELLIIDNFELQEIKTKNFVQIMDALNVKNALIVTDSKDTNVELSSRNILNIKVLRTEGLNVYDILKYNRLVLLESSLKSIEGRLLA